MTSDPRSWLSPYGAPGVPAYGGAVSNDGGTLTITNSFFMYNTSGGGSGVWNVDATVSIKDSTFVGNIANQGDAWGGAVASTTSTAAKTSSVRITNSTFIANASSGQKGSHGSYGGAIYSSRNTALTIANSTFVANVAGISTGASTNRALQFLNAFSVGAGFSKSGPSVGFNINIGALVGAALGDSGGYTSNGYGGGVYN